MRNLKIWQQSQEWSVQEIPHILCIVMDSYGSSPGKQGFKMIINEEGTFYGTVGGGIMEKNIQDYCTNMLQNGTMQINVKKQYHHKRVDKALQSGLICSGRQTIALIPMKSEYQKITECILQGYDDKDPMFLEIDFSGMRIIDEQTNELDFTFQETLDGDDQVTSFSYTEKVANPDIAYVFGGGHVGTAISSVLKFLDFYVIQIDNRELSNLPMKKNCDEYKIIDYTKDELNIRVSNRNYAIIATYSMHTDIDALLSITDKPFRYMGLMGSKSKIKAIYKELASRGISESFLDKVNTPIGIKIKNETPEEIAISVAAELVNVRNSRVN